jgi:hypothetical protein
MMSGMKGRVRGAKETYISHPESVSSEGFKGVSNVSQPESGGKETRRTPPSSAVGSRMISGWMKTIFGQSRWVRTLGVLTSRMHHLRSYYTHPGPRLTIVGVK